MHIFNFYNAVIKFLNIEGWKYLRIFNFIIAAFSYEPRPFEQIKTIWIVSKSGINNKLCVSVKTPPNKLRVRTALGFKSAVLAYLFIALSYAVADLESHSARETYKGENIEFAPGAGRN